MKCNQKIAVAIACILILGIVHASAGIVRPLYVAIDDFSCSLSISSGNASCFAMITPTNSSYTPSLTLTLKRSTNGVSWNYVDSWFSTGSGIFGAYISESKSVSSGYQYKLFATGTIRDANGTVIERATKNSSIKLY